MDSCSEHFFDHPIFNPLELMIQTPAMKSLHAQIHQWLWTGATGALIKGEARTGKTTAMQAMGSQLITRNKKPIPVHRLTIHKRDEPTIRSLFRNMCLSANLHITAQTTTDKLSDCFMHYLLDLIHEYQTDRVVLIVDEMQRLKPWQLDAFAELYDQLRDPFCVSLMVIFVANDPECKELIEQMENASHAHLHGRFFTLGADFMGITSEKSVKICL